MRQPKIDTNDPNYETVKTVYDDINEVEQKIDDLLPIESIRTPNNRETPKELFRIVFDGNTVYLYIKTSRGWKKATLS